jgi:hypothetical protein
MIWSTPEGASIQWTAIGDGLVDWKKFIERWRHFCPRVPFQIETISGFARSFPYKSDAFWRDYDKRPDALAQFEALAARGHPLESFHVPDGVDKKEAERLFQKAEIERSIDYCRKELGLGIRKS